MVMDPFGRVTQAVSTEVPLQELWTILGEENMSPGYRETMIFD
jgi:hypothetical protein